MTSFQKANSGSLSALPRWPLPSSTTSEKGYLSFSELFLQQERERQRESLRRRIAENAKKWTEYHARLKEYNGRSRSREATKQEQEESSKSSPPRVFDDGGGPMDRRRASCCANLACAASTSQDISVNAWPDNTALLARSSSISHAEDELAMQHIGIIRGGAAASEMYGAVQVDDSSDNEEEEDEELDAVVDGQLYFRTRKSRASVRDFLPLHVTSAPAAAASQSSPSTKEGNRLYAPSNPTKRPPGPQHHTAGGSGSGASSSSSLSSSFDMASSLSGSFSGNSSSSTGSSSSRPPSRRYSERTVESCESVSTDATSLSFAAEEAEEGDSKPAGAAA